MSEFRLNIGLNTINDVDEQLKNLLTIKSNDDLILDHVNRSKTKTKASR